MLGPKTLPSPRERSGRGNDERHRDWYVEPHVQRLEFHDWVLLTDPAATAEVYAGIDLGGAEICGCKACFNFAEARHLVYSTDLIDLFEFLGIDPLLESEVAYREPCGEGSHLYSTWFHLVGRIESGPIDNVSLGGAIESRFLVPAGEGLAVAFSADRSLAPSSFEDLPAIELEVSAVVPWVSLEPEPD